MNGSLRRPRSEGGSWAYRIDGVVGAGQARRQVQVGGFATEADAAVALESALVAQAGLPKSRPGADTVEGFVHGRWLKAVRGEVAEAGWRNYLTILDSYVLPRIGSSLITRLTTADVEAMYRGLLASGGKTGGGLAGTTVMQVHRTVRRMLNDAVRWGLIRVNPAIGAHVGRVERRPMDTWTIGEVGIFVDSSRGDRLWPLWVFALHTGMRRGELAGLRWRDVDLEVGRVSVALQRTTANYRIVLVEPKAGSRRTIAIAADVVTVLRAHAIAQATERSAAGLSPARLDDTVFADRFGVSYHPQRLRARFAAACVKAGLPVIRLHDLRHTMASVALTAGIHPKVVQERLGQSSVKMTIDVYSHIGSTIRTPPPSFCTGACSPARKQAPIEQVGNNETTPAGRRVG